MPNPFRNLRSALPAALIALSLATGVQQSSAQSNPTIQHPFALGITLAKKTPYNFTGRVFDIGDAVGFGSGTLLRRHTVLTAGHVLYDPTAGFTNSTIFTRGLYGSTAISSSPVIGVSVLGGYQQAVDTEGNTSSDAFAQDQGYLLLGTAPVDENWANYTTNTTLLTSPTSQFFVLGYPGVTFDGRTLAYIVPMSPFVQVGTTGSFTNENYTAEEGMSGGPIYVVLNNDPNQRYVAADTVGGIPDSSGEFNISFVRAIDKTSGKFLAAAEYTAGLIKKVKVLGPKIVARGTTVTFTAVPIFKVAGATGVKKVTTDRYTEIQLKSSAIAIKGQVGITVTKTSNTTFSVNVPNVTSVRPGAQVTLQAYFDYKNRATPAGKSSFVFTIQ